jgi:hypothetical protein
MRFVHLKQFWIWLSSWNPEPNGCEFGILNSSHMEANKGSDFNFGLSMCWCIW